MKNVIILNGPPGVGKDTIANELYNRCVADELLSFKGPIFDIAEASLGKVGFKLFMSLYNDRSTKESPCEFLGGLSPREFMIEISETFIKPIFGSEYFGRKLSESLDDYGDSSLFVVTDGGFTNEIVPLAKRDGARVFIIRLHRDGYSFKGDSRDYISAIDVYGVTDGECNEIQECDIEVIDDDIDDAVGKVANAIKKIRREGKPNGGSCCNRMVLSDHLPPHGCRLCENCGHIVG